MADSKKENGSSKGIVDKRFASFETDPRYRLPSKKQTKTTIDKRFSRMLNDDDFTATAKVDRYGRKIKSDSKKKALERLYQEEEEDEEEEKDQENDRIEVDDDEVVQRELEKAKSTYDPARGGGFSSASEDEDSSDEDEDNDEEEGGLETAAEGDLQRLQDEQVDVEAGEVSKRIAIVNLDWDHVKSADLMALFSSFIPPEDSGRIEKISIYPSEFGKERMQQEELEGPPKELFKKDDLDDKDSDEASDDEDERIKNELITEGDDQDFDSDALRKYQLDRLRYYYAVMVCSSLKTAQNIYEATDGTEYQSSSNFLDLRFIPDEVAFEDEPRDVCDRIPDSYKPKEFVTNALQSSKVKLTWDMHPEEVSRKEAQKRAFTGSRSDIQENDLKAYLASDSENSDVEVDIHHEQSHEEPEEVEPKLSKKELARRKMREALGLGEEAAPKASKNGPVGDMQISFTPALSGQSKSKSDKDQAETTLEKYTRKEKERKEQKRQKAKAKREEHDPDAEEEIEEPNNGTTEGAEDLGFDDPFFTTEDPAPVSKSSVRKEERRKKREAREAAEAASASQRAHLEKVMADGEKGTNQADHLDHFDMTEIARVEKANKKKGKFAAKKVEKAAGAGGLQKGFKMDIADERFKAVFDNHEYAIDPSNPKFKATENMNKLLEERRRKRQSGDDDKPQRKKRR